MIPARFGCPPATYPLPDLVPFCHHKKDNVIRPLPTAKTIQNHLQIKRMSFAAIANYFIYKSMQKLEWRILYLNSQNSRRPIKCGN